ncbi:hypothetical protein D9M72_571240 [compost metagenome]
MHRHELRAHETRHVDHVEPVGLGEAGGLGRDLGELRQEGRGHVDQRMGREVVEADLHHAGRELVAPRLRVLAQVAELFEREHHALRRALGDVGGGGHVGQRHRAAAGAEGAQHGQAFFQRLVEQKAGAVVLRNGGFEGGVHGFEYSGKTQSNRISILKTRLVVFIN